MKMQVKADEDVAIAGRLRVYMQLIRRGRTRFTTRVSGRLRSCNRKANVLMVWEICGEWGLRMKVTAGAATGHE